MKELEREREKFLNLEICLILEFFQELENMIYDILCILYLSKILVCVCQSCRANVSRRPGHCAAIGRREDAEGVAQIARAADRVRQRRRGVRQWQSARFSVTAAIVHA